ncbi:MAG: hypothetical protein APF84_14935 [Gracilibacter sp. BRH_c7a]|nr:MAG: hypothetical protein APF84_14935 [Gracilibacter sp. BRH_c7a]
MRLKLDKKKVIAIIGIFVVGLIFGVGTLIFKGIIPLEIASLEKYKQAQAEKKSHEIGPLLNLEEIIVNLDGGGILKTEITIEGTNDKSAERLKEKEVFLRDRTIAVLASKQINDVKTTEGHLLIKEELIHEMNEISKDDVKDVLFRNFIYSF